MFKIILSYFMVYTVWGTTFYFSKLAVDTIPPYYVVSLRSLIAVFLLLGIVRFRGKIEKPTWQEVLSTALVGCLLMIGGSGIVTVAVTRIDSYLAALIISCIPLCVMIFDRFLLKRKITANGILGIVLGITGVAVLLYDSSGTMIDFNAYYLLLLVAVISWSLGTTLSSVLPLPKNSFLSSCLQFVAVTAFSFIGIQFSQPVTSVAWAEVSLISWLAVGYLGVLGSLAFASFVYLVQHEPNYRVVTYTLVNPLIAIALGLLLGGEQTVPGLIPGALLILLGLAVMFYGEQMLLYLKKQLNWVINLF